MLLLLLTGYGELIPPSVPPTLPPAGRTYVIESPRREYIMPYPNREFMMPEPDRDEPA